MGGWCGSRDRCAHYLKRATRKKLISERLCPPDREFPEMVYTKAQTMQRLDKMIEKVKELSE